LILFYFDAMGLPGLQVPPDCHFNLATPAGQLWLIWAKLLIFALQPTGIRGEQ